MQFLRKGQCRAPKNERFVSFINEQLSRPFITEIHSQSYCILTINVNLFFISRSAESATRLNSIKRVAAVETYLTP